MPTGATIPFYPVFADEKSNGSEEKSVMQKTAIKDHRTNIIATIFVWEPLRWMGLFAKSWWKKLKALVYLKIRENMSSGALVKIFLQNLERHWGGGTGMVRSKSGSEWSWEYWGNLNATITNAGRSLGKFGRCVKIGTQMSLETIHKLTHC